MKIGLALGGGAARGYAHIGVLKALERHGIKPDCVAGCSMGALLGAIYCSGISASVLEQLAINISPRQWMDISLSRTGIMSGKKLESLIYTLTGGKNIEDLPIPFIAVATDVMTSSPYIFKDGPIHTAVRASTAIPGIFEPVSLGDRILVDGGFVDNVPVDLLDEMEVDLTIAVDVGFSFTNSKPTNLFEIILLSIDTMQKKLHELNPIKADLIIKPDVSAIRPNQFEKAADCIKIGEETTEDFLSKVDPAVFSLLEKNQ
ncbi:patatin-like phospholipase family protein [Calorimonas adulescens]|uniref:Patatin-like phospholipase family protein n=1 Tax=Calorimonas adulescens TaxID=2606906 RepID=A0A5D8QBB0_9THEO|nr:patatin-like phospholipase family protein [Calorimonas adulescens]TZE81414.1 patatin-like phospholipase family protein [Calorimonas adulescens]